MAKTFAAFETLASTFQRSVPGPAVSGFRGLQLHAAREITLPDNTNRRTEPAWIYYLPLDSGPSFNSLLTKLDGWLTRHDHPSSPRILKALLQVLLELLPICGGLVEAIVFLEGRLKKGRVTHFIFFPHTVSSKDRDGAIEFGGFAFGHFDLQRMRALYKHAGYPWLQPHGPPIENRPGLATPSFERTVFDLFGVLVGQGRLAPSDLLHQASLRYMEALAAAHVDMALSDFDEQKLLLDAFGLGIIDSELLRHQSGRYRVTVFQDFRLPEDPGGWVVADTAVDGIGFPSIPEAQCRMDDLAHRYRFSELGKSSLHDLVLAVCRNLVISRRFKSEQRLDEACLYQVIALEQVFSEKVQTTLAVSGRTAALVHRQLGVTYEVAKKAITSLYDARSAFVHKGKRIDPINLENLEPVSLAVLKALIHLCHLRESAEEGFKKRWLKRLDHIIAGYEAEIEPSAEMALANGIIEPDDTITP